ncbi:hypothetical protein ACH4FE_35780 [Streptomyces celluloflavus]
MKQEGDKVVCGTCGAWYIGAVPPSRVLGHGLIANGPQTAG